MSKVSSRTRRSFLRQASAATLALGAARGWAQQISHPMGAMPMPDAQKPTDIPAGVPPSPLLRTRELAPFVDPLPLPVTLHPDADGRLRVAMREVHVKLHRDVPPTRLWVYAEAGSNHPAQQSPLSPLIEARSGQPMHVEWLNQLPTKHFLPIDYSLHGCGHDVPDVRACVHLHGARTPSKDDGQPDDWFLPGQSRICNYPLQQDAATLWYHDHAMGLNRLNIYAGLLGMAIVRDTHEDSLALPSGKYEVPLTLYDRQLLATGQLFYPDSGDPEHPWVPEFSGDAILLNGKIRPYLEVEPRLYRFRLLNAANSSFFQLSLTAQHGQTARHGQTAQLSQPTHSFIQIGSDQGLLAAPVTLKNLSIAPAERADLLIDFSNAAGKSLHLTSAGATDILQFRVAAATLNTVPQPASIPTSLRTIVRTPVSQATLTRQITLDEVLDRFGNSMLMVLNKKHWHEAVTEKPKLNSTEIWEFINLTEDTHPLHLHLVRFQILDRRLFDVFAYRNNQGMHYISDALPLEANEQGWKDIVPCPPEIVTRIIVTFDGYPGDYLYHCHVLEHEAKDMMRPYQVVA